MTDVIRLISIDPWKPRIDQTFAGFPVIISGDPQADVAIEPRWTCGQWCEINDAAAGPQASLHGTGQSEADDPTSSQLLELTEGGEFQLGIRTFRVSLQSTKTAKAEKELVAHGG